MWSTWRTCARCSARGTLTLTLVSLLPLPRCPLLQVWYLAAQDMLEPGNRYRLCDTGQGLNRVQNAPTLGRAMHQIVARYGC